MQSRFSEVRPFVTPWTVARQAPLSMGFSRQEHWSGLLCPPSGDFPNPGIEPASPVVPALWMDSLPLSHLGKPTLWLNHYSITLDLSLNNIKITCSISLSSKKQNQSEIYLRNIGASLAVWWLRLHTSTAGGTGLIPGLGTKIP